MFLEVQIFSQNYWIFEEEEMDFFLTSFGFLDFFVKPVRLTVKSAF